MKKGQTATYFEDRELGVVGIVAVVVVKWAVAPVDDVAVAADVVVVMEWVEVLVGVGKVVIDVDVVELLVPLLQRPVDDDTVQR